MDLSSIILAFLEEPICHISLKAKHIHEVITPWQASSLSRVTVDEAVHPLLRPTHEPTNDPDQGEYHDGADDPCTNR